MNGGTLIELADQELVTGLLLDINSSIHRINALRGEKKLTKPELTYLRGRLSLMKVELTSLAVGSNRFTELKNEFNLFQASVLEITSRHNEVSN